MTSSALSSLPDELLEAIVVHLSPNDSLAFGSTCRRCNKITYEPLVWRRHCLREWRYWESYHELADRLASPPARTKWHQLYKDRKKTDSMAVATFEAMLKTQLFRFQRMEELSAIGYDVKDLMMRLRDHTPDHVDDVLARRFHANAVIGLIHRSTAVVEWTRLQKNQSVSLEDVLGAFDLFILGGKPGDLSDVSRELDRIAQSIRAQDFDFDALTTRERALRIARYLRSEQLVGNPDENDYHALRNNFISIALFDNVHTSLPLQSVAIYCTVARRLGVNAKPSNYPYHAHAVVEAPNHLTLDGRPRTDEQQQQDPPEHMHLDPWRSSDEVPLSQLVLRLTQMGAPVAQHALLLGPASDLESSLRTARNIMNSVQESRDRRGGANPPPAFPDIESAWYSMLWAMVILGDSSPESSAHRRRSCMPYLLEHHQAHFPEDIGLVEHVMAPMFQGWREHRVILQLIHSARKSDRNRKAPSPRDQHATHVTHRVGQHFRHKRYGYAGFIIGWDLKCGAETRWIQQMRVDELPRGRHQPFYNVV